MAKLLGLVRNGFADFRATHVCHAITTGDIYQLSTMQASDLQGVTSTLTVIVAYTTLHVATRLQRVQVGSLNCFWPYRAYCHDAMPQSSG